MVQPFEEKGVKGGCMRTLTAVYGEGVGKQGLLNKLKLMKSDYRMGDIS